VKIEVAVPSSLLEKALQVISSAAETGKIGDGKIFVTSLSGAVRIRTGERDEKALQ
jgi:nitrogen regulatory protein PII